MSHHTGSTFLDLTGGEKLGSEIRSFLSCTITSRTGLGVRFGQNVEKLKLAGRRTKSKFTDAKLRQDPIFAGSVLPEAAFYTFAEKSDRLYTTPELQAHSAVSVLSRCCHGAVMCSQLPTCSQWISMAQYADSFFNVLLTVSPYTCPILLSRMKIETCMPESRILESSSAELLVNSKQRPGPQLLKTLHDATSKTQLIFTWNILKLQLMILSREFDKYCWSQAFFSDPAKLI